jgi:hypothetical protein
MYMEIFRDLSANDTFFKCKHTALRRAWWFNIFNFLEFFFFYFILKNKKNI